MKHVKHTVTCNEPGCSASFAIEIAGRHDLRSVSQLLEDVAGLAGWTIGHGPAAVQLCYDHRRDDPRMCTCSLRRGIQHEKDCATNVPRVT